MCPADKLVGCQYEDVNTKIKTEDEIYDELSNIAQGIFLSIDNNMLTQCQKAVHNKVMEVCGSLDECAAFDTDDVIGTDSLISYKNKDGDTVIDGLINFGLLGVKITDANDGAAKYDIDKSKYNTLFNRSSTDATINRILSAINTVSNRVKQKLDIIALDPTVRMCINGRDGNWRYSKSPKASNDNVSRFPHLLDSYGEMIFNAGLEKAYQNYNAKYDELVGAALEDQNDDVKSALCAAMSYTEGAPTCTSYATFSGQPVCTAYSAKGMQNLFGDGNTTGMDETDGFNLRYVVKGADIQAKLANAAGGKGEYISTDSDGNMVGMITMTSVYSPANNVCTLTTTTAICENMQTVITEDTEKCKDGFKFGQLGSKNNCNGKFNLLVGINTGGKTSKTTQTYHGNVCTKYAEPVTETKEIKM